MQKEIKKKNVRQNSEKERRKKERKLKMSSLEEEKFAQMIHDFIESSVSSEESSSPIYSASASSQCFFSLHQNHQPSYHLTLQEILRSGTEEAEYEVLESVKKYLRSRRDTQKSSSNLKKCLVKKLKIDGFNASLCHTSWPTSLGCPAGEYEYIDIISEAVNNDHEPIRLILDLDFKSQFELARPTPTYKDLTNSLPTIFVGKAEKLNKIITLLCSAAKQSLKERGLHFPPWRTITYMQSKWLSKCQKSAANNNNNITESTFGRSTSKPTVVVGVGNISAVKKGKKRSDFGGGSGCSGLSSQFSNLGINCC